MRRPRPLQKPQEIPDKPAWRDYFQVATTFLMVILGGYILWQTVFVRWAIPSLIFSIALLLFGLYRIKMLWIYVQQKRKRHGA